MLLDQSMVLEKLNFSRDQQGNLRFQRRFSFEFTSMGNERYAGELSMLGQSLIGIKLATHKI